jgi:hypothetical protein
MDLDQIIMDLDKRLEERDQNIREISDHAEDLEYKIIKMQRSIIWQLMMKFNNGFVERALPQGSQQREIYDLGIEGGTILVNYGWRNFIISVKEYIKAKLPDRIYHSNKLEVSAQNEVFEPEEEYRFVSRYSVTTEFLPITVPIDLKKGPNIIKLHVPEGCEQPCSIVELNSGDTRFLSLAVKDLKIKEELVELPFNIGNNWHGSENYNGEIMRWMANDATIYISPNNNCHIDLSLQASSFYSPRTLEIYSKYLGNGPIIKKDKEKKYMPLKKVDPRADMDKVKDKIEEIVGSLREEVRHE